MEKVQEKGKEELLETSSPLEFRDTIYSWSLPNNGLESRPQKLGLKCSKSGVSTNKNWHRHEYQDYSKETRFIL